VGGVSAGNIERVAKLVAKLEKAERRADHLTRELSNLQTSQAQGHGHGGQGQGQEAGQRQQQLAMQLDQCRQDIANAEDDVREAIGTTHHTAVTAVLQYMPADFHSLFHKPFHFFTSFPLLNDPDSPDPLPVLACADQAQGKTTHGLSGSERANKAAYDDDEDEDDFYDRTGERENYRHHHHLAVLLSVSPA
jgi:hypothetical protein